MKASASILANTALLLHLGGQVIAQAVTAAPSIPDVFVTGSKCGSDVQCRGSIVPVPHKVHTKNSTVVHTVTKTTTDLHSLIETIWDVNIVTQIQGHNGYCEQIYPVTVEEPLIITAYETLTDTVHEFQKTNVTSTTSTTIIVTGESACIKEIPQATNIFGSIGGEQEQKPMEEKPKGDPTVVIAASASTVETRSKSASGANPATIRIFGPSETAATKTVYN